jgi:hypothetical protein
MSERLQRYYIKYPESVEKINHVTLLDQGVWCKASDVTQLESENAALKAQHDRDEKEKRVLADVAKSGCPAEDGFIFEGMCCPNGDVICDHDNVTCWLAYAKQEVGK